MAYLHCASCVHSSARNKYTCHKIDIIARVDYLASFKERNRERENGRAKSLYNIFEKISAEDAVCIVEGLHDVNVLRYINSLLGINIKAITYDSLMNDGKELEDARQVFVMMDDDYGGRIKEASALHKLNSLNYAISVDTVTGKRMLGLLGIKCVEQIKRPLENALDGFF